MKSCTCRRHQRFLCGAVFLAVLAGAHVAGAATSQSPVLPALSLRGRRHVSIQSLKGFYGFPNVVRGKDRVRLRSRWTTLELEDDHRNISLNGISLWLGNPVTAHRGDLWVSQADVTSTLDPLLRPRQPTLVRRYRTIMIDPGHGGSDAGARSSKGLREEDVVLDISKRLAKRLEKRKIKVLWTRRSDTTTSLESRMSSAGRAHPQLFLSIHCNAAASGSARGVETYCMTPQGLASTASSRPDNRSHAGNRNDRGNIILAYQIQRSLVRSTGSQDRGVRRARFYVLKDAPCPAALVELGFLSNTSEAARLGSSSHRERLAAAIDKGIAAFEATLAPR